MIRKYSFTTGELQRALVDYLDTKGLLEGVNSLNLERASLNFVIDNASSTPEIKDFSVQIDDGELEQRDVENQD